ncbi:MAG TPA: hypothetical protein VEF76_14280 [Patescibacteria group bacterium]|nr:hypothetical protein [Patescibacteria group bacterium]
MNKKRLTIALTAAATVTPFLLSGIGVLCGFQLPLLLGVGIEIAAMSLLFFLPQTRRVKVFFIIDYFLIVTPFYLYWLMMLPCSVASRCI